MHWLAKQVKMSKEEWGTFFLFAVFMLVVSGIISIRGGMCYSSPCGSQVNDSEAVTVFVHDHFVEGQINLLIAPTGILIVPVTSIFGLESNQSSGYGGFADPSYLPMSLFEPLLGTHFEYDAYDIIDQVDDVQAYLAANDMKVLPVMFIVSYLLLAISVIWWFVIFRVAQKIWTTKIGKIVVTALIIWTALGAVWIWLVFNMTGYSGRTIPFLIEWLT